VFTTRVDTVFGTTFMAIAPDHPLAVRLAESGGTTAQLAEFAQGCRAEAKQYGPGEEKPKRGIPLGLNCVNPFSQGQGPIWATNYVLGEFGTGAVMGVPGHDTRDHAFAIEYGMAVSRVIRIPFKAGGAYTDQSDQGMALERDLIRQILADHGLG